MPYRRPEQVAVVELYACRTWPHGYGKKHTFMPKPWWATTERHAVTSRCRRMARALFAGDK